MSKAVGKLAERVGNVSETCGPVGRGREAQSVPCGCGSPARTNSCWSTLLPEFFTVLEVHKLNGIVEVGVLAGSKQPVVLVKENQLLSFVVVQPSPKLTVSEAEANPVAFRGTCDRYKRKNPLSKLEQLGST